MVCRLARRYPVSCILYPMIDIANLSIGVVMLLLRVAVVFLLYFFLWQVMRVVARDLRNQSLPAPVQTSPFGQLVVASAGQTGIPVGKVFHWRR